MSKSTSHPDDTGRQKLENKVDRMMDPSLSDAGTDAVAEAGSGPLGEGAPSVSEVSGPPPLGESAADNGPSTDTATEGPPNPKLDQPAPGESPLEPVIESPATDKAVDDISHDEADKLLAQAGSETAPDPPAPAPVVRSSARWRSWLRSKILWKSALIIALAALAAVAIWPRSRYLALNFVGVRGSASVKILDQSSLQPLKNVRVSLGNVHAVTGSDGQARLSGLKMGPAELNIEKRAFAPVRRRLILGWGSNPLGDFKLEPTGSQYMIKTRAYLTGKAVKGAEASVGESSAVSDDGGLIKLTVERPADTLDVTITSPGYRTEKIPISAEDRTTQSVKMVPDKPDIFISKRSGLYDVYRTDIDGKNEQKLLAGTGSERDDIILNVNLVQKLAALVSTRDNKRRNADGFLLSSLSIVDASDGSVKNLGQAEQFRVLGWSGSRLAYIKISAGASAADNRRQRLVVYDAHQDQSKELASANFFNAALLVGGSLYYAPSGDSSLPPGLYRQELDGSTRQSLLGLESWDIFRATYDKLAIAVNTPGRDWYEWRLGDKTAIKLPGPPADLKNRVYVDSPDGRNSLWIDNRDGKGVLLQHTSGQDNDRSLHAQSGLTYPVQWLNDTDFVYRVNTEQESADYAMSLNGGEPLKVRDVASLRPTDHWYYY